MISSALIKLVEVASYGGKAHTAMSFPQNIPEKKNQQSQRHCNGGKYPPLRMSHNPGLSIGVRGAAEKYCAEDRLEYQKTRISREMGRATSTYRNEGARQKQHRYSGQPVQVNQYQHQTYDELD